MRVFYTSSDTWPTLWVGRVWDNRGRSRPAGSIGGSCPQLGAGTSMPTRVNRRSSREHLPVGFQASCSLKCCPSGCLTKGVEMCRTRSCGGVNADGKRLGCAGGELAESTYCKHGQEQKPCPGPLEDQLMAIRGEEAALTIIEYLTRFLTSGGHLVCKWRGKPQGRSNSQRFEMIYLQILGSPKTPDESQGDAKAT